MSSPKTPYNILVVEDEWLVALDISMLIEEQRHVVIGPAQTVASALELINTHPLHAAFLDISLGAENSFPVAEKLEALAIPLTFVSAYTKQDIPAKFHKFDILPKPLPEALFRQQFLKMLGQV